MTPIDTLREVLRELKDAGAMRATIKLPEFRLAVEFAPEMPIPESFGTAPAPGGWKTLRLDEPTELDPK
mgnify:FL=1